MTASARFEPAARSRSAAAARQATTNMSTRHCHERRTFQRDSTRLAAVVPIGGPFTRCHRSNPRDYFPATTAESQCSQKKRRPRKSPGPYPHVRHRIKSENARRVKLNTLRTIA